MAIKIRPNPAIPDHEVLRKIGGGAYGEVWLARGVTGALRAVKVVWREDFEDARGFEREFEGILKFEPMSRDHPALVNILHVGRSPDGVSFYYYVMELGDDVRSGQDINPIEYEPRTLRADNHQGVGVQWDTSDCIDVGLRLSEALDHLHERGLAHRDVKPSNVIFVNGRAKLADIGLVATRGQRTFVGTEGFVPPEGPGSSQADVYSLGKVLYEIATGKDRLSFPELPEVMPSGVDRKRWLELNRIICDICEPRISKRKISSASDLADALRRLQRGKRRRQSGLAVWMTTSLLVGFSGWAGWEVVKDSDWVKALYPVAEVPKPQTGTLRVVSSPPGAEVFDASGKSYGTTPNAYIAVTVGDEYSLVFKKPGYSKYKLEGKVMALTDVPLFAELKIDSPPQTGEPWKDHLGNSYQPVAMQHESSGFVTKDDWVKFSKEMKRPEKSAEFLKFSQNGQGVEIVLAKQADSDIYCEWFRKGGNEAGYLPEDFEVSPMVESSFDNPGLSESARRDGLKPFRLLVRKIPYGEITVSTDPPGAEIYMSPISDPSNQISKGPANSLPITHVKPGVWLIYPVREGYGSKPIEVKVGDGEKVSLPLTLEKSKGVVFGKRWENGIGMRFAPVGQDLMASVWETRVKDYERFVKESNPRHAAPRPTDFPQTPDDPVVNVSREEARAFCEWLTEKERKGEQRIAETHIYRLPTDLEWSLMADLKEDPDISPSWRHARKQQIYPWGLNWLQNSVAVGNFADASASREPGVTVDRTIADYDDGFPYTAPVGKWSPNSLGLYDLGGNVQEWVDDDYSQLGTNRLGVLRGGGWSSYQAEDLYVGSRNPLPPTFQDSMYGFRVVLAKVPPKTE
ncbi:MAG: SUMF1/EgtB/PvdO family nonheme iron enzyme [Luteolibacter sp.]|uniref:SUMF1/EgtB/PvdO family nonheme iron enzyme n=1 Tax=Luteolibacter sp. TaxID=1962973 RepID=UPI0032662F75